MIARDGRPGNHVPIAVQSLDSIPGKAALMTGDPRGAISINSAVFPMGEGHNFKTEA